MVRYGLQLPAGDTITAIDTFRVDQGYRTAKLWQTSMSWSLAWATTSSNMSSCIVETAVDRAANIGQAYRQFFFFVVRWQQNENHYSVSHCGIGGWPGPLNCGGEMPWHPLEV